MRRMGHGTIVVAALLATALLLTCGSPGGGPSMDVRAEDGALDAAISDPGSSDPGGAVADPGRDEPGRPDSDTVTPEDTTGPIDVAEEALQPEDPGQETVDPGTDGFDTADPHQGGDSIDDRLGSDGEADPGQTDEGCVPLCEGRECGDDGCGGVCGTCRDEDPLDCIHAACEVGLCVPRVAEGWCLIDDVCREAMEAHPDSPCAWCDPLANPEGWTPREDGSPCTTGGYCTVGETCLGGFCQGGAARDCSGAVTEPQCQTPRCDEGERACTADAANGGGSCDDRDPGTVNDACLAGECVGCMRLCGERNCGDDGCGGSCGTCLPSFCASGPFWVPAQQCVDGRCRDAGFSLDCNDGIECTLDQCDDLSGCSNPLRTDWCFIYDPELERSYCIGAGMTNGCAVCDPSKDPYHWSQRPDGSVCGAAYCDDGFMGLFYGPAAVCTGGQCRRPREVVCYDGLGCTRDLCDEQAGCIFEITENMCMIEGACYRPEDLNPVNACQVCRPSSSQTSWSKKCQEPNPDCLADGACRCWTGSTYATCDPVRSNQCLAKLGGCRCGENPQCSDTMVCRLVSRVWTCVRPL